MNKDPNVWSFIVTFWRDLITAITSSNVWLGGIMAVLMTYFRNLYDDEQKSTRKQIAECIISGGITLSITTILDVFNMPSTVSICVGGAVGLLGVDHIRKLMKDYLSKKTDRDDRRRRWDEEDDDL